ncbi:MAG: class I SAM-dependent methyltransferase [Planctomycetota bacterium]|nr:class I SAM-dependent methyltransferase [Planctomycetota bacterium]
MSVVWVPHDRAWKVARSRIRNTKVVLDVGSGRRPQSWVKAQVHICVDPHLPYLLRLMGSRRYRSRHVLLNCEWDTAMKLLPSDSVDSVLAFDFIEHLDKESGHRFLREAKRVARRQIVVFTPLGFYPQSYKPGEKDSLGMDGASWQTHVSGWDVDDFKDGWDLVCCEEFHKVDQYGQLLERPHGAFWAIRNLPIPKAASEHNYLRRFQRALHRIFSRQHLGDQSSKSNIAHQL